jgi:hypothetical protein
MGSIPLIITNVYGKSLNIRSIYIPFYNCKNNDMYSYLVIRKILLSIFFAVVEFAQTDARP